MQSSTEIHFVIADALTMAPDTFVGFHTMIVDPPYSEYVHKHMASHGVHGRGSVARDPGFDHLSPEARAHLGRIAARMSRWSLVFTDHESTHLWRSDCEMAGAEYVRPVVHTPELAPGFEYEGTLPWVRWSQPQLSGDRPPQGSECVLHFHRVGEKRTSCPGNLVAYTRRALRQSKSNPKHPTEKPLDLLLDMVSWWSDPGDNVVDPMAGAGTTALACKLLGRSCLAIERDAQWTEYATRRIACDAWSTRDLDRAREWCDTTEREAGAHLAKPAAANGEDANTRRRAQARLDDAARVRASIVGAVAV